MIFAVQPLIDALLESAQEPTWIVGSGGTLVRFNASFARLFEDLQQRPPAAGMDVHAFLEAPWPDLVLRTFSGRSVSTDASLIVRGFSRRYSITGTPVLESGLVTHAIFAARELADAGRDRNDDLFELSLTRLFIDDDRPLLQTLRTSIQYLCESDDWDCGVIWLLGDGDTSALDPLAIYASASLPYGEELSEQLRGIRFTPGRGLPGRAWASDDILWIGDISEESTAGRAHIAERLGLHGAVAVPLRDGPRVVGVLELFTRKVRPVDELRARSLLQTGAGLGRLIERRRADEERRRLLQVIERKGLEWSLTFDAIELPIFITSMEGIVRRMNRSARDLAGGDYAEALGQRVRSFGRHEPWTTLAACVEAVRDSGENCSAQAFDAESDRTWDISANTYRPVDEPPRVILIARETTSVVRLQNAVKRGEQLSALGELVAGVAHEVRNPLFGMQITLDALETLVSHDADSDDLFHALRRWLDRLNRLMESLLAYGRTWSIDLQQGSLADVLHHALEGTAPVAESAHVEVHTNIEVSRPMLMDASRLAQAFENLLLNAIQHTSEGGAIELEAREAGGFVECRVRDRGPGFSPEDLPRIFEPFFTRRRGGTGLGLAIVQRIVDEHGGTLHATNADTGGAMMTLRFPVFPATPR